MPISIVSDLHLENDQDEFMPIFLAWIKQRALPGEIIVLAGDIFDVFVGSNSFYEKKFSKFFETLKETEHTGVTFHYIEGNHDFNLRRMLARFSHVHWHDHQVIIEEDGKKTLIEHGDLAKPNDYGYRLLRWWWRTPLFRFIAWMVPGSLVEWFGVTFSKYSRHQSFTLPQDWPEERRNDLKKLYLNYVKTCAASKFDFVVMGHCHDAHFFEFTENSMKTSYINVGFPKVHRQFVRMANGTLERLIF